ncbi:TIGR00730 family Rossman fold protein [Verrucomicrobium spinosum]|uniref:LOG family protein n=1 Tax=Verrucomicrobium spinosum TaxID=2736 RepID=UPI0001745526|nr:TIGR00730 family Rossman fold protein [Verrucomicrobium spinosum]
MNNSLPPKSTSRPPEKDFTAGGIFDLAEKPRGTTGDHDLDDRLKDLASTWVDDERKRDLVAGLLMTSLKIGRDNTGMGDLKMLHRALREMRHANKVFQAYRHIRKVSVFGSARTDSGMPAYHAAETFSQRMVEEGFMVITGAGDGIMGAAQRGAGREQSFGLNIRLPFEQSANDTIVGDEKLVTFNYFFTRKLSFVKEADAVALFPGGFGTMDEMFESITLMQTGKASILPVVLVDEPGGTYWSTFFAFVREHLYGHGLISQEDMSLVHITDSVDEAVRVITTFYKVFHSYRHVKERTVFRIKRKLTPAAVTKLNTDFADIIKSPLEQASALPEEQNEEGISHLPRLIGTMKHGEYGRWRQLIDAINMAQVIPAKL